MTRYTEMPVQYFIDQSKTKAPPKLVSGHAINSEISDKWKFAVHCEGPGYFVATEWRTGGKFYIHETFEECVDGAIRAAKSALASGLAARAIGRWERREV